MAATASISPLIIVCPNCSLILKTPHLEPKQTAVCPRCAQPLHRYKRHPLQKGLALSLAGLLFYVPANVLPLMTFSVMGLKSNSSIFHACIAMFADKQFFVATIVTLTTLLFPLLLLSSLLAVTLGLSLGWRSPLLSAIFRGYHHLGEWAMTDVFLVGVLITIIKMAHLATVSLNGGFFCLIGLVVTTVAAQTTIDAPLFWAQMERKNQEDIPLPQSTNPKDFLLCHDCHKLLPANYRETTGKARCPRCGHLLHQRKPNSIARSWALVLTAMVLTLPANLLPIMEVDAMGDPSRSTIMDGIIYFFQEGSYGIGLVILIASVLVPLFKIIGMSIILLSIHFRWHSWLKHKAVMFRLIEFIGRWSMLDIFVITLLCSLAQFGFLTSITAAPASLYFTGVVLSTMFAALSFDPRLLWDAALQASTQQ